MIRRAVAALLLLAAGTLAAQGADVLTPTPVQHFMATSNTPCSGCQLFTYQAGTTTKLATYTDSTGGTPNADPVILNTRGEANVWLPAATAYKFVLAPPTDTDPPTNPIWTVDQIDTSGFYDPANVAITGGTISGVTISNSTINSSTLNSPTINTPTISGGTISGTAITGGSISGTTLSNIPLSSLAAIGNDTVVGNVSGGSAAPSALSTAQLTTLCNLFTTTLSGCVTGSGGGTTNFLRADGTWAAPSTSGGGIGGETVITSSGTFLIPATSLRADCWGGGQGGGNGTADEDTGYSGSFGELTLTGQAIGNGISVTIGAGGTAGNATTYGGAGGTTSFGGMSVPGGGVGVPAGAPTGAIFGLAGPQRQDSGLGAPRGGETGAPPDPSPHAGLLPGGGGGADDGTGTAGAGAAGLCIVYW